MEIQFTVSAAVGGSLFDEFYYLSYFPQFAALNFLLTAFANYGTRLA